MVNKNIVNIARTRKPQITQSDSFKQSLQQDGYVIWQLNGFDEHKLPATPILQDTDYIEKVNSDLHADLLRFHFDIGLWPVVYEGENDGHLIRHVCPILSKENTISSQGGKYPFYPHVDNPDLIITGEKINPYLGSCPDTLTLLCLRGESGVNTNILLLDEILKSFDKETIEALQLPQFKIKRPASFENSLIKQSVPMIVQCDGIYYSRFDCHNASGMTKAAEYILEKLRSVVMEKELWINIPLNPGDAVTFLNQRVLHTRNSFSPRYDGTDRWLLRVFGLFNKPINTQLLDPKICEYHLRTVKEDHV